MARRRLPALLALLLAPAFGCGDAAGPLVLHGTVEIQEVRVGSRRGGRVAEVLAEEGRVLEAGAAIVRFEAPDLEARLAGARARLEGAEAALLRARNGARPEERAEAAAALAEAREGLALLRAGARPEEVAAARAALEAAAAGLDFAERDFARTGRLLEEGTVARADLDAARSALDGALARRDEAKARLALLEAGSRKEEIAGAEAGVRRLEAAHALLEAGTRAEDVAAAAAAAGEARAALAEAEADLAEAVVRAPEPALLEVLSVRKGDLVPAGGPVARLLRASDLWVKVFVPETEVGRVAVGRRASVAVDSFPGRSFEGEVAWIGSGAEFTPRNVQSAEERRHRVFAVKVRVADPGGVFKSGMAASVTLEEGGAR
jgi:multidrug resistance efflux pump